MTRRPPRVTLTDTLVPYRTLFRSRTHPDEGQARLLELARTRGFRTVIAYASRTGTRRNLDALRDAGWRLMVSARGVLRTEGFPYELDNGAWTSFQHRSEEHTSELQSLMRNSYPVFCLTKQHN